MGPDSTPKVFHPGPKQRSTGDVWRGRTMVLVGNVVMQKTVVNDKMSIETSRATPRMSKKNKAMGKSKREPRIHDMTRPRFLFHSNPPGISIE